MSWQQTVGKLLGLEDVEAIDGVGASFAAPWAQGTGATWVWFGCLGLVLLACWYYARRQRIGRRWVGVLLSVLRGTALSLLLLLLAEPVLKINLVNRPKPLLWLLIDVTDSMAIRDELPEQERKELEASVGKPLPNSGLSPGDRSAVVGDKPTRLDYVQSLFRTPGEENLLTQLQRNYRVRAFAMDQADGVRPLDASLPQREELDPVKLAEQLRTVGQVTALGAAIDDLSMRHSAQHLAGLVVVSDFGQNAGVAPAGGVDSPAKRLNRPIYTLGVGPRATIDLTVDLQAPLVMKKNEDETLTVQLRQQGLDQRRVLVRLYAERQSGDTTGEQTVLPIGQKEVTLNGATLNETFPYKPPDAGRFRFRAVIEAQPGEVVTANNQAEREVNIRDDFLRLMYVEHEPTWEWRFVKEVFHRDKLVGLRGFRTFLNSADPKVRQTNELFLPNLTPKRADFFANDVIFLGDLPAQRIQGAERFCEMTREFVANFGGGLVVIAGPRFGPGQLAGTALAEMLPVTPNPQQTKPRTDREFTPQLTNAAWQFDFMRLGGGSDADHARAWANLGRLPWYQPVLRVHPQAVVLAEHPTDLCADGKTKQPLIAIRPYGKGEVLYVAFNELWRLRRIYGERYYRQFWGQLIHRLGLSHAIGNQKRFVLRTDRDSYQADELVTVTVEAYNENYEPLTADKLADKRFQGELLTPTRVEGVTGSQPLSLSQLRDGVFEARFPVGIGGEYLVRIVDPITRETTDTRFRVTSLSAERRSATRNTALEEQLTAESGGRLFDLANWRALPQAIASPRELIRNERVFPLGSTWLWFGTLAGTLIVEWLIRKWSNLA